MKVIDRRRAHKDYLGILFLVIFVFVTLFVANTENELTQRIAVFYLPGAKNYVFAALVAVYFILSLFKKNIRVDVVFLLLVLRFALYLIPTFWVSAPNAELQIGLIIGVLLGAISYYLGKTAGISDQAFAIVLGIGAVIITIQIISTAIIRNLGVFSSDLKWYMVIPTGQTNAIGTYYIFMFIMFDGFRRVQRHKKRRTVLFVIEAFLIVVLPLMGSRSTLLLILLYVMVRYIMPRASFTQGAIIRTILSIIICILILIVAIIISSSTVEAFLTLFNYRSMTYTRFEVYKEAFELFLEHPIFGRGPYSYHVYDAVMSHNFIIETLVQQGIVGSIPYVAALIIVLRRIKRTGKFHATYFYAIVFCLFKGLMEPMFFSANFEVFFWFFVGVACRKQKDCIARNNVL